MWAVSPGGQQDLRVGSLGDWLASFLSSLPQGSWWAAPSSTSMETAQRKWCGPHNWRSPELREAELRICLTLRLPWWSSDSESTCQCRRHGFNLWLGKILHAADQLNPHVPQLRSLCSRAREPQLLSPRTATAEARSPTACAPQ